MDQTVETNCTTGRNVTGCFKINSQPVVDAMPFETVPGLPGKIYIPVHDPDAPRKNKCRDCYVCQLCSDNRRHFCVRKGTGSKPSEGDG